MTERRQTSVEVSVLAESLGPLWPRPLPQLLLPRLIGRWVMMSQGVWQARHLRSLYQNQQLHPCPADLPASSEVLSPFLVVVVVVVVVAVVVAFVVVKEPSFVVVPQPLTA